MKAINYILAKILYRIRKRDKEVISSYFRHCGMSIGTGCNICCNILNSEPYLVSIGNNVTISGSVKLTTHDNSISKVVSNKTDICGAIKIGNNCFIGRGAMILLGVTLADDIIVAAGSVVTKSFNERRIIIAGNPAKKIGTWDQFEKKYRDVAVYLDGLSADERKYEIKKHLINK